MNLMQGGAARWKLGEDTIEFITAPGPLKQQRTQFGLQRAGRRHRAGEEEETAVVPAEEGIHRLVAGKRRTVRVDHAPLIHAQRSGLRRLAPLQRQFAGLSRAMKELHQLSEWPIGERSLDGDGPRRRTGGTLSAGFTAPRVEPRTRTENHLSPLGAPRGVGFAAARQGGHQPVGLGQRIGG